MDSKSIQNLYCNIYIVHIYIHSFSSCAYRTYYYEYAIDFVMSLDVKHESDILCS
jgi:hypothetical protein